MPATIIGAMLYMPAGMGGAMPRCMGCGMPDIILNDRDLMTTFGDPEDMVALQDGSTRDASSHPAVAREATLLLPGASRTRDMCAAGRRRWRRQVQER
ncbi:uncharacterized protein [Lolium perenne]|uniref:uncharacterized protein isoform X2 n=1 Tax=Lolium perenne TaxID=4522 RepID=UPI003A9972BC